jgi:hypothetical protein
VVAPSFVNLLQQRDSIVIDRGGVATLVADIRVVGWSIPHHRAPHLLMLKPSTATSSQQHCKFYTRCGLSYAKT